MALSFALSAPYGAAGVLRSFEDRQLQAAKEASGSVSCASGRVPNAIGPLYRRGAQNCQMAMALAVRLIGIKDGRGNAPKYMSCLTRRHGAVWSPSWPVRGG